MSKNKVKENETKGSSYVTVTQPCCNGVRKAHGIDVYFTDADFQVLSMTCELNRVKIGELATVLIENDFGHRNRQFEQIKTVRREMEGGQI